MTARHATIGAAVAAVLTHGTHSLIDADRPAYQRLVATIEAEEGCVGMPYTDSLGNATIGCGTLLPLKPEQMRLLLTHDLAEAETQLRAQWPPFNRQIIEVQAALLDADYQLGTAGLLGFHLMLAALSVYDYPVAAEEAVASAWDRETPARAERVAGVFRALAE